MDTTSVDPGNAGIVPRSDYGAVIQQIVDEGHCPFCREHLTRHHREPILYEDDHWVVTKNSWPYAGSRFHFLLIAREHVEKIEDLSPTSWLAFFDIYSRLVNDYELSGATLLWRSGNTRMTGASVNHLHAHVVAGSERTDTSEPITALVGFREV